MFLLLTYKNILLNLVLKLQGFKPYFDDLNWVD